MRLTKTERDFFFCEDGMKIDKAVCNQFHNNPQSVTIKIRRELFRLGQIKNVPRRGGKLFSKHKMLEVIVAFQEILLVTQDQ